VSENVSDLAFLEMHLAQHTLTGTYFSFDCWITVM
jgi:hypothetical protein